MVPFCSSDSFAYVGSGKLAWVETALVFHIFTLNMVLAVACSSAIPVANCVLGHQQSISIGCQFLVVNLIQFKAAGINP